MISYELSGLLCPLRHLLAKGYSTKRVIPNNLIFRFTHGLTVSKLATIYPPDDGSDSAWRTLFLFSHQLYTRGSESNAVVFSLQRLAAGITRVAVMALNVVDAAGPHQNTCRWKFTNVVIAESRSRDYGKGENEHLGHFPMSDVQTNLCSSIFSCIPFSVRDLSTAIK